MHEIGFRVLATRGTAQAIHAMGVPVEELNKIGEGSPHVGDRILHGEVDIVINTPAGRGARADGWEIRRAAVERGIPCITTMTGASAAVRAIGATRGTPTTVRSLQELHRSKEGPAASPEEVEPTTA
jgi:carbamoyl-phosphate synthase large subunit